MILNILLTIFLVNLLGKESLSYEKGYLIATNTNPLYIYWITNSDIFVSDISKPFLFNLDTREKENIVNCINCIPGYDGEIIFCQYIHKEIQSEEESSTQILIRDKEMNIIKEFEVFPTVIPIVCKKEFTILKTAYAFLEQKTYLYNQNGLKEINIQKRNMELRNYSTSRDKNRRIIYDIYGNLWLYNMRKHF